MKKLAWTTLLCWTGIAVAQPPMPPADDRIRIAEAYRLADSIGDEIWPGWSEVPFVVLLLTPEHEYLVRHPFPPADFSGLGHDEIINEPVFARPSTGNYALGMLATFPAIGGINTVVIGQPAHTGKSSTQWVITALHEHFHQLQYTRPWYYEGVEALDLSGGDQTGMWQLNYPFPYQQPETAGLVDAWREQLEMALNALLSGREADRTGLSVARTALYDALEDSDQRYLAFQLWQEGVARYTEHAVARFAANHHSPLPAFTELADHAGYSGALAELEQLLLNELRNLDAATWQRVIFYPLGAAESLLLEAADPGWKQEYFTRPFALHSLD